MEWCDMSSIWKKGENIRKDIERILKIQIKYMCISKNK